MSQMEEGDMCPNCEEGAMEYPPTKNCYCHLSAPCSNCTDKVLTCYNCGYEDDGD